MCHKKPADLLATIKMALNMTMNIAMNMAMMMLTKEKSMMATTTQVLVVPLLSRSPLSNRLYQRTSEEVG